MRPAQAQQARDVNEVDAVPAVMLKMAKIDVKALKKAYQSAALPPAPSAYAATA